MTGSATVHPVRMVLLPVAVLLAAVGLMYLDGTGRRDERSYQAGYSVIPDRRVLLDHLAAPGVTPETLCADHYERALRIDETTWARDDFIAGCRRAVAEGLE